MKRIPALMIMILALFVTASLAHDTWILCDPAVVASGRTLSVRVTSGEKFPASESAPDAERVAKAEWRIGDKRGAITDFKKEDKSLVASGRVTDAIRDGSGAFQHGHTYLAHPLACAAALEVQRIIDDEHLLDQVKVRGRQFERRLTERFGNHRHVGDIRGRGLFWAIELVADRNSREPFDLGEGVHHDMPHARRDSGGQRAARPRRGIAGSDYDGAWTDDRHGAGADDADLQVAGGVELLEHRDVVHRVGRPHVFLVRRQERVGVRAERIEARLLTARHDQRVPQVVDPGARDAREIGFERDEIDGDHRIGRVDDHVQPRQE
jgi:hypothetical protein